MELSLEAYRDIVKNIRSRADIAKLCTVSRGFQYVAERALYNTLYMQDIRTTMMLCDTLSRQPRVSVLVDALTVSVLDVSEDDEDHDSKEEEREEAEEEDGEEAENLEFATALEMSLRGSLGVEEEAVAAPSRPEEVSRNGNGWSTPRAGGLPSEYWNIISRALRKTTRLRHFNIHINSNFDTSVAWILEGCTFRLRSFHCDLNWDQHLVTFLNSQTELDDLYIIDYNERDSDTPRPHDTPRGSDSSPTPPSLDTTTQVNTQSLSNLSTLECTFSEAAVALIPGRPVVRLKTCFSRSDIAEKKAELYSLFSKIRQSTRKLLSLDMADSSYSDEFSMELLRTVVATFATSAELRYLGTLVLPIAGHERLSFYGLLMRLHKLSCVELEVSEWEPSPLVGGFPAFRALANELRLYCPTVNRVVFVHDFERTVVSYVQGRARLDADISPEILWRDV